MTAVTLVSATYLLAMIMAAMPTSGTESSLILESSHTPNKCLPLVV